MARILKLKLETNRFNDLKLKAVSLKRKISQPAAGRAGGGPGKDLVTTSQAAPRSSTRLRMMMILIPPPSPGPARAGPGPQGMQLRVFFLPRLQIEGHNGPMSEES